MSRMSLAHGKSFPQGVSLAQMSQFLMSFVKSSVLSQITKRTTTTVANLPPFCYFWWRLAEMMANAHGKALPQQVAMAKMGWRATGKSEVKVAANAKGKPGENVSESVVGRSIRNPVQ
jgi:hypothetical protein